MHELFACETHGNEDPNSDPASILLKQLDMDANGSIDFEEFMQAAIDH